MSLKLKLFCVFIIYCLMETLQVQSAAIRRKREMDESHLSREKREVELYDANAGSEDGKVYADATFAQWNDGRVENNGKVLYANSGAQANNDEIGFNGEVGFIRHKAITPQNFGVEHDVMTAGVDVGFGRKRVSVMGKAAVVDGTLHLGPANVNYGVAFDTGFTADGRNVEVKFLGNGFKVGADGIQGCLIFCLGGSW